MILHVSVIVREMVLHVSVIARQMILHVSVITREIILHAIVIVNNGLSMILDVWSCVYLWVSSESYNERSYFHFR